MAWFDRRSGSSPQQAQSSALSTDDTTTLLDPGLPDGELKQLGYRLFNACGLTYLVYGPGSLAECFDAWSAVSPAFKQTEAAGVGIGNIGGRQDSAWLGYEGPSGSMMAYHCFPDGDSQFLFSEIAEPLRKISSPWTWSLGTVGAKVPEGAAAIFADAKAAPVWTLPRLGHTAPTQTRSALIPELLRNRLVEAGWVPISESLLKAEIPVPGSRSQLLYFASWNESSFAVLSPVADSIDGSIPAQLRGKEFANYKVDVVADMVVLADRLPAGPPSPTVDDIVNRAIALGQYADRIEGDLSIEDKY